MLENEPKKAQYIGMLEKNSARWIVESWDVRGTSYGSWWVECNQTDQRGKWKNHFTISGRNEYFT